MKEADRRGEQDQQLDPKNPKYYPLPNPWRTLIEAPCVPAQEKLIFRAAESWLVGLRRLHRIAYGMATLNRDVIAEIAIAERNGALARVEKLNHDLAQKLIESEFAYCEVKAHGGPELVRIFELLREKREKEIRRQAKNKRNPKKFEPRLKMDQVSEQQPFETFLVENWLRFNGQPWSGLMFWGPQPIAKLFGNVPRGQIYTDKYVEKVRQRLGLIPVGPNTPYSVWRIEIPISKIIHRLRHPTASETLNAVLFDRHLHTLFTPK